MASMPTDPRFKNLLEQRFGRLVVREFVEIKISQSRWKCLCDCGKETTVARGELLSGDTQSCGCLQSIVQTIHGQSRSPEFLAWDGMIQRCHNPKHPNYHHYGGRGIIVCQEFMIPQAFLSTVGQRPSPKHSLDRIDNNGSYTCGHCPDCLAHGWPENWRWATKAEQLRNTRRNVWITIDGVTKCAQDWANIVGISCGSFMKRYRKWPEHKLLIPVLTQYQRLRHPTL